MCLQSCLKRLAYNGWPAMDCIGMLERCKGNGGIFDHSESTFAGNSVQDFPNSDGTNSTRRFAEGNAITVKKVF
jgi:hypothetical protein